MFRLDRLGLLVLICLVSGITLSLFFEAVGVQAKQPINPNSLLLTPTAEPSSPGQPCGSGQQLPPDIICLYGAISQQSASGVITPFNGVLVTITLGSQSVTGTTFVHPGDITPTYSIDIHFLNPQFLQPVTLTAVVDNMLVSRQVIVFPDFQTMSQRYDLVVPPVESLPQGLWGYVVDFASGGPVTGAVITAEHDGQSITATTSVPDPGNDPYYQLDPSTIASPGEQITLTATFNGETEQKSLILPSTLPVQINFVTGWHCDDFNPLPGTTGPGGLPGTTGPGGLPDVGCFWGYILAEGRPVAGANVHLRINGSEYQAQTSIYSGESIPRYSVGVWHGQSLSNTILNMTAVYSGQIATKDFTVTLDASLSQRVDLTISQPPVLTQYVNGNSVNAMALHNDGSIWVGTNGGGVIHWSSDFSSYEQFTIVDGLISNEIMALAVAPDGSMWFGANGGLSHYVPGATPEWQNITIEDGLISANITAIAIEEDNEVWIGTQDAGIAHSTDSTYLAWEVFTTSHGLVHNFVQAIAIAPDDSFWFGTAGGLNHYLPGISAIWETFTVSHGLASNSVKTIAIPADGFPWVGHGNGTGVSHYLGGSPPQWEVFTTADGLVGDLVRYITVSADQSLWFGTWAGVSQHIPGTTIWNNFNMYDGLIDNDVRAIIPKPNEFVWFGTLDAGYSLFDPDLSSWQTFLTNGPIGNNVFEVLVASDNTVWMGTDSGLTHYSPGANPEWQSFTMADGLVHSNIRVLELAPDGSLWIGTEGGVSHYTPGNPVEWENFTTADGLIYNNVFAIAVAPDGSIWFGTLLGVSRYQPGGNPEWETIYDTGHFVRDIEVAGDGTIWFGTWAHGVSRYTEGGTPEWETFTTTHGLISDFVWDIFIDPNGPVWFSTSNGASRYIEGTESEWTNYQLGGFPYSVYEILKLQDDSVWFAADDRVHRYTPGGNPEWEVLPNTFGALGIAVDQDEQMWLAGGGLMTYYEPYQHSDLTVRLNEYSSAVPGAIFTHTISLTNLGQRDAFSNWLTVTLPTNTIFITASPPPSYTTPLMWYLDTVSAYSSPINLIITASLDTVAVPGTFLTSTATASTHSPEAFLTNNLAQTLIYVLDPYHSDLRITASGSPILVPGEQAQYSLYVDNIGGLAAANSTLTVILPAELEFLSASIPPVTINPLIWDFGTLSPLSPLTPLIISAQIANNTPPGVSLTVSAAITTTTPDSNPNNNMANVTIATSLNDARTLLLVAPDRLASRYGASPLMGELYQLAQHPLVEGAILDVMGEPTVAAAYTAWDADPGNWQRANEVAEAIKALIDQYTLAYPNLQYLVIVGGDEIIPFYRLADQNSTVWQEDDYAPYLRPSTVQSALASNRLLTDDFYADRLATTVNSPFWFDGHPLYIPDFALGRLVETPEEMVAVIDAFLVNNGIITLGPGLVGTLPELTDDLGDQQCDLLQNAGLGYLCTHSSQIWKDALLNNLFGSFWLTVHGNHFSVGSLYAHELTNANANYDNSFLANLSCHGGLNDPQPIGNNWPDLPQSFLSQGGSYLGSTAYTYASWFGVQYSEALAAAFLGNLLVANPPTLGQALVQTKQDYYAAYGYLFTYLDEKVLVPTTFYGLPMLQVDTTPLNLVPPLVNPSLPPAYQPNGGIITLPFTRNNLTFDLHTLPDGQYYSYQGQVQATHYQPVQPVDDQALPADVNGAVAHGFVLTQATFSEEADFDPRIAESWILGGGGSLPIEPAVTLSGWDHPFPVYLTQFTGLLATKASVTFILGAYDADREVERLYEELTGEVLYSDSPDWTPPTLISQAAYTTSNQTIIEVQADDDSGIVQVVALCDEGQGSWTAVNLTRQGQTWRGSCPFQTSQFMVQLVDAAANVTRTPWQTPSGPATFITYLPLALRP